MARKVRYRIQLAPTPRSDGTGGIDHDLWGIWSDDNWETANIIPNYHKTVPILAAEMKVVMDLPHATIDERRAKRVALRSLIQANTVRTLSPAPLGWTDDEMLGCLAANDAAVTECAREVTFIMTTLGKEFPWDIATE